MVRLDYKLVEGFQEEKPAATDVTSSKNGVYLRKDFRIVNNEDPTTGQHWKYMEAFLTLDEYQEYLNEKDSVTLTTVMQTLSDVQLQLDDIQLQLDDLEPEDDSDEDATEDSE